MENIHFKNLSFVICDGRIFLANVEGKLFPFVQVQVAGENKATGAKMIHTSEGDRLQYVAHELQENRLEIVQRSVLVETKTVFQGYDDTTAVRIYTEIKNISRLEIVLQEVSAFVYGGLGETSIDNSKKLYFTQFIQSHHAECQPRKKSFFDFGLHKGSFEQQKRISFANIGSWSTKASLPQGIIENSNKNTFLMYQIERNHSWYYEISDENDEYYLYLSGANETFGGWCKALQPQAIYTTPTVALAFADTENNVINEMTKYRRQISGKSAVDTYLPTIFNEYMHLSWDSPTAENTFQLAPIVAKTGVEYYVIDCGWHNEEPGNIIYPFVGQWKESKARFPEGVRKTTDYIRSLGMKAGLWIEPEIIGCQCQEMLDYYDDDCFLQRNGKRLCTMGRHFLDFRAKKVVDYLTETIRRMVEDYGADYIKLDYNQDCGTGTDYLAFSAGEGLEQSTRAYLQWVDNIRERFPNVLFETCSSGGMRMDYETLSQFSIISTSDQVDYLKYPYIVGNILSAVLPEQAAVWSYPVGAGEIGKPLTYNAEWVKENITNERIIMNMINSFLGRMHLASHLELLTKEQFSLVQEGVEYYNTLTADKKKAMPYFPLGFTKFGDDLVVSGLKTQDKIYLAVWNLSDTSKAINIPFDGEEIVGADIAYPKKALTKYTASKNALTVCFESGKCARFFEIQLFR